MSESVPSVTAGGRRGFGMLKEVLLKGGRVVFSPPNIICKPQICDTAGNSYAD
jgi:hypothetical protein